MRCLRSVFAGLLCVCSLGMPGFLQILDASPADQRTPWAASVTQDSVLPEYPRPLMRRQQWLNLNGSWQFQACSAHEKPPFGQDLAQRILVPFPWESALSGIQKQMPEGRAVYRRTFALPEDWKGQGVLLHFGAVDWQATVYLNGRYVGEHRGGFDPFSFEVSGLLRSEGPQELVVVVFDPGSDAAIAVGKQSNERFSNPGRYSYSPSSGIWQTVWLEPVPETHITGFHATPDIDTGTLEVTVAPNVFGRGLTVELIARDGSRELGKVSGELNVPLTLPVPTAQWWWPHKPKLHDLEIRLKRNDKVIDQVIGYFAMRKVALVRERINQLPIQRIAVNNRFIFNFGPLDQGYWPDGLYTAPSDEALSWDIEQAKNWGYNMIRKHIKVEPQRWYYHCDRLGMFVWQDMPSTFKLRNEEERTQFELEVMRLVKGFRNHPSIINWIVFNEHWGAYDVERITRNVMALDPSRLVTGNSGIDAGSPDVDYDVGHIRDNHHYRAPTNPHPPHNRASVNGEYGAIGYKVAGHLWDDDGPWVHDTYAGKDAATKEYVNFATQLRGFRDKDALSGAVYTQLTDVENEVNGLYTYDRKIEKLDKDTVRKVNLSLWQNALPADKGAETSTAPDGGPDQIDP